MIIKYKSVFTLLNEVYGIGIYFMIKIFFNVCILYTGMTSSFEFLGIHYMASFKECNKNLQDPKTMELIITEALKYTGATVLNFTDYIFYNPVDPDVKGYTAVFLLSESHASVHTYPEHNSFFVDLFTCGTNCSWKKFHEVLIEKLEPKIVHVNEVKRG